MLLGIMIRLLAKRELSNMFKHQPGSLWEQHLHLRALLGGGCSLISAISSSSCSSNSRLRSYTIPSMDQNISITYTSKTKKTSMRSLMMTTRRKKRTRMRGLGGRRAGRKRRRTRSSYSSAARSCRRSANVP